MSDEALKEQLRTAIAARHAAKAEHHAVFDQQATAKEAYENIERDIVRLLKQLPSEAAIHEGLRYSCNSCSVTGLAITAHNDLQL